MGSQNIRDLLTSFSPSFDFFAISSGDGRIKIWDTLKGQLQTEFADITSTDAGDLYTKPEKGHLSIDYTCMKWLSLERKRKKEVAHSLLVLGTGGGDVLALNVSAGQLKWRVSDCHSGGVNAISFSTHALCIYTAGVDGMVCQIDCMTGNLLRKFKASTKTISSIAISPDGKMLATAAGQLKIFNCSDNNKIHKFSGHPGAVRCMIFSEDGKYILSSAVGERYLAVWRLGGSKKKSASCVLAMDHPAVFLDCKCRENESTDDVGLYILAVTETGLCHFWYEKNIEELGNTKPTIISLSSEAQITKNDSLHAIFAAKLQCPVKPASAQILVACGSLVKPSFEKILVRHGVDIKLSSYQDVVLLPMGQSNKSKKRQDLQIGVTALDRSNAEDALIPIPRIYDFHDKKRKHRRSSIDAETAVDLDSNKKEVNPVDNNVEKEKVAADTVTICIEDRLRSLGILTNEADVTRESFPQINSSLNFTMFSDAYLEANIPQKKIKATVLSMTPPDAHKLLTSLVAMWKSRSGIGKYVLPWIYSILVNYGHYVMSQEPSNQLLDFLYKMTECKGKAVQPLLQLSGRLQLISAQIDKAQTISNDHQLDETEDDDDDVDEFVYGEEEELSQSDSEDNN
ncbi:PREDICTED: WD repeat-containing protein 43 isoform X2 [Nelumbo nucifera]|uniref:WD repeat-containing protein 43 isoform X2 n=1 Tax=Nelumbo nucifera TaxID=4432 RepID=A0A1U7ZA37_NELNU|nr:PREDICTED: WD repeat-containing protein 43 isoform X2 [Nelumbo nucifera]